MSMEQIFVGFILLSTVLIVIDILMIILWLTRGPRTIVYVHEKNQDSGEQPWLKKSE